MVESRTQGYTWCRKKKKKTHFFCESERGRSGGASGAGAGKCGNEDAAAVWGRLGCVGGGWQRGRGGCKLVFNSTKGGFELSQRIFPPTTAHRNYHPEAGDGGGGIDMSSH